MRDTISDGLQNGYEEDEEFLAKLNKSDFGGALDSITSLRTKVDSLAEMATDLIARIDFDFILCHGRMKHAYDMIKKYKQNSN